jgi:hypothetical protein
MKLYTEDGQAIPAVQVLPDADPAPTGYTEVTTIESFLEYGLNTTDESIPTWTDKLSFRNQLKIMIYTKMGVVVPADADDPAKWNLLNAAEKKIACDYFVVGNEAFFLEVKNDARYWVVAAGEYRCVCKTLPMLN